MEIDAKTISFVVGLLAIGGYVVRIATRVGQLDFMVSELWKYNQRRGDTAMRIKGYAKENSPLKVTDEVRAWYVETGLMDKLKQFYLRFGRHLSDVDLFIEINTRFGDEIFKNICIRHEMTSGECVNIAVQLAKEAKQ